MSSLSIIFIYTDHKWTKLWKVCCIISSIPTHLQLELVKNCPIRMNPLKKEIKMNGDRTMQNKLPAVSCWPGRYCCQFHGIWPDAWPKWSRKRGLLSIPHTHHSTGNPQGTKTQFDIYVWAWGSKGFNLILVTSVFSSAVTDWIAPPGPVEVDNSDR